MEGVAHSVRWAFEALEQSADLKPSLVNIGGGGARSDLWCQIRADVLGVRLHRAEQPAAAALGARVLGVSSSPEKENAPTHGSEERELAVHRVKRLRGRAAQVDHARRAHREALGLEGHGHRGQDVAVVIDEGDGAFHDRPPLRARRTYSELS